MNCSGFHVALPCLRGNKPQLAHLQWEVGLADHALLLRLPIPSGLTHMTKLPENTKSLGLLPARFWLLGCPVPATSQPHVLSRMGGDLVP